MSTNTPSTFASLLAFIGRALVPDAPANLETNNALLASSLQLQTEQAMAAMGARNVKSYQKYVRVGAPQLLVPVDEGTVVIATIRNWDYENVNDVYIAQDPDVRPPRTADPGTGDDPYFCGLLLNTDAPRTLRLESSLYGVLDGDATASSSVLVEVLWVGRPGRA